MSKSFWRKILKNFFFLFSPGKNWNNHKKCTERNFFNQITKELRILKPFEAKLKSITRMLLSWSFRSVKRWTLIAKGRKALIFLQFSSFLIYFYSSPKNYLPITIFTVASNFISRTISVAITLCFYILQSYCLVIFISISENEEKLICNEVETNVGRVENLEKYFFFIQF